MKTYSFSEKNGNASIILSAETEVEAVACLVCVLTQTHRDFRMEVVDENEGD